MLIGIVLRLKGIGYKKDKKKVKGGKPSNKDEEEFYTPDAYVEHGDGGDPNGRMAACTTQRKARVRVRSVI